MSLASGTRLGPYEIQSAIGAGGMGEVYKARDTRLDRTVAIKVLPPDVSGDPERRARFEREAKTVAGLNHPHICVLHDVGDHDGAMFLVMEHLAGQTLAERLEKGPLPLEQALTVATEIADALSAAHRQGVIHRDLKPANVMLTKSGSKLLDFGLAKLTGHGEQPAAGYAVSAVPTHAATLTGEGVIVGTLQYMAPEQLEGKPPDARTDLWALGAILYEMVTGRRAFEGASAVSLMTAIMSADPPPLLALQPLMPAALDRMVRKCLAKDPDSRWQTASDARDELRWLATQSVSASPTVPARGQRHRWKVPASVALAVMLPLGGLVLGAWLFRSPGVAPPLPTQRLTTGPSEVDAVGNVAVSADGRLIALAGSGTSRLRQLYVRRLDEWHARPLAATPGNATPGNACFSQDSEWLVFVDSQERRPVLWKVPIAGGAPQKIPATRAGGQINCLPDGRILFSGDASGIWVLHTLTGRAELLVGPKDTGRSGRYLWPDMMPGNGAVLFSIWQEGRATLCAFSLRDRKLVALVESALRPRYVAAAGHLLYQSGRQLFAVPFDRDALKITGEARLVADEVGNGDAFNQEFDVSPAGVLVYLPPRDADLVWKDRAGKITVLPFKPRRYMSVHLSPDGRQAVLNAQEGTAHRIYRADLDRGEPLTRLTPGDDDYFGLFSPDGSKVLFTSGQGGRYNIASVSVDGRTEQVTASPHWQKVTSFWPLGPVLLINDIAPATNVSDVLELRLDQRGAAPRPLVVTEGGDLEAVFSPDGHFIAFEQTTDGRQEVYIQGYPSGPKLRVSVDGGRRPVWNPKGGELFFHSPKGVMAVRVRNGAPLATPAPLFEEWSVDPAAGDQTWDVSPDGSRFLVAQTSRGAQVNVVTNLFEELKAKVPPR